MGNVDIPSDLEKVLDSDETVSLYTKQKRYYAAIDLESIAITNKRVILRKPQLLAMKKSMPSIATQTYSTSR